MPKPTATQTTTDMETGEVRTVGFRVKRRVTVPVLKLEPGTELAVRVLSGVTESTPNEEGKTVKLLRVALFGETDNREYQIVLGAVLLAQLEDNFPNESYVGKDLLIEKSAGKRGGGGGKEGYYTYSIAEIEAE